MCGPPTINQGPAVDDSALNSFTLFFPIPNPTVVPLQDIFGLMTLYVVQVYILNYDNKIAIF